MDARSAMLALADDAAFYGFDKLHTLITSPSKPNIDFSWTGFLDWLLRPCRVLRRRPPRKLAGLCELHHVGTVLVR